MKNFFNKLFKIYFLTIKSIFTIRFVIVLMIMLLSALIIIFSAKHIKLDPKIQSLFPHDEKMDRTISLSSLSSGADKVIIYIEVSDKSELEITVKKVDELIARSSIKFDNAIPSYEDILQLLEYSERYSLLLYPYEKKTNPFLKEEIKKRLNHKMDYLSSLLFFNPAESFFLDPLMMGTEVLKDANTFNKGIYSPKFGGIVASNEKSYIKILNAGFLSEDYDKIKYLKELDNKISELSKEMKCRAFLFSSHLYYLESKNAIIFDVYIIFILSTIILLIIFIYFFRNIALIFYSFMPIIGGYALTFLLIAIFKKSYGGIALSFGGTAAGIAMDYVIHYLTKKDLYSSLNEVRKNLGFSLFLGFITTIAAFFFLPFSRIVSLQEISLFGILSIGFSFLITWFVLQRLLPPGVVEIRIKRIIFPILLKKGFVIWLIITAFFLAFMPFIKFEDNIHDLDMNHKELKERLSLIQKNFTESTDSIFLVFEGKDREEILYKSMLALNALQKENGELCFFTPALFLPPQSIVESRKQFIKNNFNKRQFSEVLMNSPFNKESFDSWLNVINNIDNYKIDKIPEYFKKEFDLMFVEWDNKQFILIPIYKRDISEKIETILLKNNIDFYIVDIVKDSADGLIKFEKKALLLLLLSIFIIYIICAISYKDLILSLISILPSISALISCFSITVITGHDFNIMHFVSCILLMGTGVDYGIFVTKAFKDNLSDEEIKMTYQSVFICALTTLAGFGVLVLSRNYSIFSLGSSMFVGIFMAFLTAYLAVPYLNSLRRIKNK